MSEGSVWRRHYDKLAGCSQPVEPFGAKSPQTPDAALPNSTPPHCRHPPQLFKTPDAPDAATPQNLPPGTPAGHRMGVVMPHPGARQRCPTWPASGPLRTPAPPPDYAATAATTSPTAPGIGIVAPLANGIPRWIMMDAVLAASCIDLLLK